MPQLPPTTKPTATATTKTPALNADCWRLVLDFVGYHDTRTLARLLLTSRQLRDLALPVLYNNLFVPGRGPSLESLSGVKRRHLAGLLLTSSGFLEPGEDPKGFSPIPTVLPKYPANMTACYYDLLKEMPQELSQVVPKQAPDLSSLCTKTSTTTSENTDTPEQHQKVFTIHHAELLVTLDIYGIEFIRLVPHVSRFRKLAHIFVRQHDRDDQIFSAAIKFVNTHKRLFPGKLKAVQCRTNTALDRCLNNTLVPEKRWLTPGKIWTAVEFPESLKRIRLLNVTTDFNYPERSGRNFEQLIVENALLLKSCPELETLELMLNKRSIGGRLWSKVFTWAKQESSILSILSGSGDIRTKPKLQKLKARNAPAQLLVDVFDGFRDSIKVVDYWLTQATLAESVLWNWNLPKLTRLRLERCRIDFHAVKEYCAGLEELELANMQPMIEFNSSEYQPWSLPGKLKLLKLVGPEVCLTLDFESLETVSSSLKTLELDYMVKSGMDGLALDFLNRIGHMDTKNWRFISLEVLSLSKVAHEHWQDLFLAPKNCPKLRQLTLGEVYRIQKSNWILTAEYGLLSNLEVLQFPPITNKDGDTWRLLCELLANIVPLQHHKTPGQQVQKLPQSTTLLEGSVVAHMESLSIKSDSNVQYYFPKLRAIHNLPLYDFDSTLTQNCLVRIMRRPGLFSISLQLPKPEPTLFSKFVKGSLVVVDPFFLDPADLGAGINSYTIPNITPGMNELDGHVNELHREWHGNPLSWNLSPTEYCVLTLYPSSTSTFRPYAGPSSSLSSSKIESYRLHPLIAEPPLPFWMTIPLEQSH